MPSLESEDDEPPIQSNRPGVTSNTQITTELADTNNLSSLVDKSIIMKPMRFGGSGLTDLIVPVSDQVSLTVYKGKGKKSKQDTEVRVGAETKHNR